LEQLIGREATGKFKEASVHTLEVGALPGEDLVAIEARPSHTNVTREQGK
jgi:hypothetical protein